jgi:hypothetical protein
MRRAQGQQRSGAYGRDLQRDRAAIFRGWHLAGVNLAYSLPIFGSAISSIVAACILAGTARARVPLHGKELK